MSLKHVLLLAQILSLAGCGVMLDNSRESQALKYTKAMWSQAKEGDALGLTVSVLGAPAGIVKGAVKDMTPTGALPVVEAVETGIAASQGLANPSGDGARDRAANALAQGLGSAPRSDAGLEAALARADRINASYDRSAKSIEGDAVGFDARECLFYEGPASGAAGSPSAVNGKSNACSFQVAAWSCDQDKCVRGDDLYARGAMRFKHGMEVENALVYCPSGAVPGPGRGCAWSPANALSREIARPPSP